MKQTNEIEIEDIITASMWREDPDLLRIGVHHVIERVGRDGLQLYLYHFPQNSGVPYGIDVVARLREAYPDVLLRYLVHDSASG